MASAKEKQAAQGDICFSCTSQRANRLRSRRENAKHGFASRVNLALGNIEQSDADKLLRLTHQLYKHIYAHYDEMEVLNEMTDESLILDIDIIEKKYEEKIAAVIAEKDQILSDQAAEIATLKKQLAEALAKQH